MLEKVLEIYNTGFDFESFEEVNPYFKRIINSLKQMNYSVFRSDDFNRHEKELHNIIDERKTA